MTKQLYLLLIIILLIGFGSCRKNDQSGEKKTVTKRLTWDFPLPRTHTGILVGNGVQGLMIWGYDNHLNITVGRSGFWDHRGGNDFASRTTYKQVRKMLEAGDEAALRKAFSVPQQNPGYPQRPHQIGGGRIEIQFPDGWKLKNGFLRLKTAVVRITVSDPDGKDWSLFIRQSMFEEITGIQLPAVLKDRVEINLVPAAEYILDYLNDNGISPPEIWTTSNGGGFIQRLPEDDPLSIQYRKFDDHIFISSSVHQDAKNITEKLLEQPDIDEINRKADDWWSKYWEDVPSVQLPDAVLQEIVDYGLYKLACVTPPHGIPCSLQGPFNEEYQLIPWSNDYHFNINIEMIYWPLLASNRLDHFTPLWDMLKSWWPVLTSNGEKFFEREGAIMLPHAVDDRCKVVGSFWTGTIDHACTAWMAQMAWLHYRYGLDQQILEEFAWPLMVGAFEGYWAMLEEIVDEKGVKRLSLPVSVSPEFKGSRMDAWGRDASFQLAALHMTASNLQKAADILGIEQDPRWQDVKERLPLYTTIKSPRTLESPETEVERVALWQGMDLIESHRHHSYLSGIYPFMTYDPLEPEHREILNNTYGNWVLKGPGLWSGWCVPWASILNTRFDRTRAAIQWLHWWRNNFVNEGRGTLHNAAFQGASLIDSEDLSRRPPGSTHNEVMQLDAGFGALSAVYELLVQDRQGVIYVLPDIPYNWKNLSFEKIRTEGAFQISASVKKGKVEGIDVKSLKSGTIRLAHGLGNSCLIDGIATHGFVIDLQMKEGEIKHIMPLK